MDAFVGRTYLRRRRNASATTSAGRVEAVSDLGVAETVSDSANVAELELAIVADMATGD